MNPRNRMNQTKNKTKKRKATQGIAIVLLPSLLCVIGLLIATPLPAFATVNPAFAILNDLDPDGQGAAKACHRMLEASGHDRHTKGTQPNGAAHGTGTGTVSTTDSDRTSIAGSGSIETLRASVDKSVIGAFDQLKFTIVVNPDATCLGCFSPSKHTLELQTASIGTFRHEMGHFLDTLRNKPSQSAEFASVFDREKAAYDGPNSCYITKNPQEYFTQSYRNYLENGRLLKAERPLTYAYVAKQVAGICPADISGTYGRYSCYW